MKLPAHNYVELVGLTIVLLATTFQLTILSTINNIYDDGNIIRMDEKINLIWSKINDSPLVAKLPDDNSQYFAYLIGSNKRVEKQREMSDKVYTIVMIIGSALIVYGRWLELSYRAKK